jgi:hypothetical protein
MGNFTAFILFASDHIFFNHVGKGSSAKTGGLPTLLRRKRKGKK